MHDLHQLPKFEDGLSYLYVEHCKIDQEQQSIAIQDLKGKVPVPCAALALLMLGPGTNITHAAIRALAENGCLVMWCGEEGIRFYAQGTGETRSAARLLKQARLFCDPALRTLAVEKMYKMRFNENVPFGTTIEQMRGKEGIRVRNAYAKASKDTGIPWHGRQYNRAEWGKSDTINKVLSAANACLYGLCHAAIVTAGYSPSIGFIHTGKQLSFVYDIADLYKVDLIIPMAFRITKEQPSEPERQVRLACRDLFRDSNLLAKIIPDIDRVLDVEGPPKDGAVPAEAVASEAGDDDFDVDPALPGKLWDPDDDDVQGGRNFGDGPR
nr:type I-E CRISPR-associated endonuclease Cas1e [Candidatus Sigynarchaeota archaeon]